VRAAVRLPVAMAVAMDNLDEFIEMDRLDCSNQDTANPVANAFKDDGSFLGSDKDVDHQLLVRVSFRQPVKISAIRISGNAEDESGPRVVKVFQGKHDIGFAEAEDETPTQSLELEEGDVNEGKAVQVRFVKFQNVQTLQLFFEANFGSEVTKVSRIQILGQPSQAMDMKAWKPVKG